MNACLLACRGHMSEHHADLCFAISRAFFSRSLDNNLSTEGIPITSSGHSFNIQNRICSKDRFPKESNHQSDREQATRATAANVGSSWNTKPDT